MTQLMKGNEAIVKGAALAGCRAYYGYPITPASEIAERRRACTSPPSAALPPGRERGGRDQHGLRRGRHGRAQR